MEENLNVLTDLELITMAKEGSSTATEILLKKYESLVLAVCNSYFVKVSSALTIDKDVVIQDGRVGLLNAINTYDECKEASFKTYAKVCISNKVINTLKKQTKDGMSFNTVSLDSFTEEIDEIQIPSTENTEEEVIFKSLFEDLSSKENSNFSDFERMVLRELVSGLSYKEIALELDKSPKSIDNTIQRLKKKIYAYLK